MENAHASYRVPRGYEVADELAGTIPANDSGAGRSAITLAEVPAFGSTDLGAAAGVVSRNVAQDRPPKRLADTRSTVCRSSTSRVGSTRRSG